MKLNSAQLERTLGQFEAQAIPDDHPVIPQLNDLFGEHTFFLDPGTSGAFFHFVYRQVPNQAASAALVS